MNAAVRRPFEELQRRQEAVLLDLGRWPVARLQFRPSPTSWSALDVLDHAIKVEKGCLQSLRQNLPEGHKVGARERFGAFMVITVMRSPTRVRTPAAVPQVLPAGEHDLAAMTREWQIIQKKMTRVLDDLSAPQLRCGLFPHPVSGWMTAPQAMSFLAAHLRHHRYQLNRLERATRHL